MRNCTRLISIPGLIVIFLLYSSIACADNIYVASYGGGSDSGSIQKFDSDGTNLGYLSYSCGGPMGIAINNTGDLYVAAWDWKTILKIDSSGKTSNAGLQSVWPWYLAFDKTGNLFEATYEMGLIEKFDSSGNRSIFASELDLPVGLAFDNSGFIYVVENFSGSIDKFSPTGDYMGVFGSGLIEPQGGIAFDRNGNLFVSNYGNGTIDKFDSFGNKSTFAAGLYFPMGLAFDSGGNLYVTESGNGKIDKFDTNGNRSTFATGIYNVTFITTQAPEPASAILIGAGLLFVRLRKGH